MKRSEEGYSKICNNGNEVQKEKREQQGKVIC
jgi:hypothetical protein